MSNLGDLKNPSLKHNVMSGTIPPSKIATMTTEVGVLHVREWKSVVFLPPPSLPLHRSPFTLPPSSPISLLPSFSYPLFPSLSFSLHHTHTLNPHNIPFPPSLFLYVILKKNLPPSLPLSFPYLPSPREGQRQTSSNIPKCKNRKCTYTQVCCG